MRQPMKKQTEQPMASSPGSGAAEAGPLPVFPPVRAALLRVVLPVLLVALLPRPSLAAVGGSWTSVLGDSGADGVLVGGASTLAAAAIPLPEQVPEAEYDRPVPLHPEAEQAIGRLRSPWCPGFMLEVCPSPDAAAFRDTLRIMANEGVDADSLVEWALARHGEEWSALPRSRGAGLLAWLGPPLALLLGIGVVVLVLRHIRKSPDSEGESAPLTEAEEQRIEEALREMEREGR